MSKHIVMSLLSDRPIAYHPDIARIAGSVKAGVFLSQLLYWSDRGMRNDGYIFKIQTEWEKETALSIKEQQTARKELKKRGLISEKKQGIPAKLYYKPNTDAIYEALEKLYRQTSIPQTGIQESPDVPDSDVPEGETITESTIDYPKITQQSAAVSLFHEVFQNFNPTDSQKFFDDLDYYGEEKMIEALHAAKKNNANRYGWCETRLRGKAKEAQQSQSIDSLWEMVLKANQNRTWRELPPNVLTAVRKVGGESRIRAVKPGYETNMLKKELASHAAQ